MCLSIKRFSKSKPDFLDTTGSSGTSPETLRTAENNTKLDHETERFKRKQKAKVSERERKIHLNSSLRLGESLVAWLFLPGSEQRSWAKKIFGWVNEINNKKRERGRRPRVRVIKRETKDTLYYHRHIALLGRLGIGPNCVEFGRS